MELLDDYQVTLPSVCIITDDPFRVKTIAAHFLDNVKLFTETRGQVGLAGKFNNIPLVVLSAGIGITSTMAYFTALHSRKRMKRVVYLGDCTTNVPGIPVGSATCIRKAYENDQCFDGSGKLLQYLEMMMVDHQVSAQVCVSTTNDHYLLDRQYRTSPESQVLDFATSAVYRLNQADRDIETISILTVCENVTTNEKIDEATRQGGCHSAMMLALHTAIFQGER